MRNSTRQVDITSAPISKKAQSKLNDLEYIGHQIGLAKTELELYQLSQLEKDALEAEIKSLHGKLKELHEEKVELDRKILAIKPKSQELDKLKEKLSGVKLDIANANADLLAIKNQISESEDKHKDNIELHTKEIKSLQSEKDTLQHKIDKLVKDAGDAEIAYSKVDKQLEDIMNDIATSTDRRDELADQLVATKQEIADNTQVVDSLKRQSTEIELANTEAKGEIDKYKDGVEADLDIQRAKLTADKGILDTKEKILGVKAKEYSKMIEKAELKLGRPLPDLKITWE